MKLFEAVKSGIIAAMAVGFMTNLTSCDSSMFDHEGNCDVTYSLNFVYEKNLKWADAFASEVKSVNVYAFDDKGLFVKEFSEAGDVLESPGFEIPLDLDPGKYTFVGWCGLAGGEEGEDAFSVAKPTAGVTTLDEMTCRLNTLRDTDNSEYSNTKLPFMFHGKVEAVLPDTRDGQHYRYTMELTKNTNHIRVMIQQLGEDLDKKNFTMSMKSANGVMAYDNSLVASGLVDYRPWNLGNNIVDTDDDSESATRGTAEYYGIIADMSTCRMMADRQNEELYLSVVYTEDGAPQEIIRVPAMQYVLLTKKYCEEAYGHKLSDQEFLDRQDEYTMTFFLDENMRWTHVVIEVLTWRVVRRNYNLG